MRFVRLTPDLPIDAALDRLNEIHKRSGVGIPTMFRDGDNVVTVILVSDGTETRLKREGHIKDDAV